MSGTELNGAKCPKHKNYKGLNPTKRDCDHCRAIYERIQDRRKDNKPYRSIVSPGERVSCFQMLSELSCYQVYGQLPPGFWRKGSGVKQEIRDHYNKTYRYLMSWRKRYIPARDGQWNPVQAIDTVFYHLFLQKIIMGDQRIHSTTLIREKPKQRASKRSKAEAADFGGEKKKSKFQALLDLGGNNGEKAED